MSYTRLIWRIGVPFVAFVLAGSIALVAVMGWNLTADERARFEKLAATNAEFIDRVGLPPSERMAFQLHEVIGHSVFFRQRGELNPPPPDLANAHILREMPADGVTHRSGTIEGVAVPLKSGHDLVLARFAFATWREVWQPHSFAVLAAFWVLALLVAWTVVRGLVQPLRHLAARLPDIDAPAPINLPEADRSDEIGDLARAFLRTREALREERSQREQAEKLAVLGRMTAALAHEIQNPVSAIKMHAQLWPEGAGSETARVIEDEAARIESLVNQWMFLSKPQAPAMSEVDVSALLAQVVRARQPQLVHAQIEVAVDAPAHLLVQGDARRLAQVFSNLLMNAIQAMPMGGVMTVRCRAEGGRAMVTLADSGRGFSPEALLRFSEFFYSEKEGGMGIGLSVAMEIVKAHGGELMVKNCPEGGAAVTVSLPLAQH